MEGREEEREIFTFFHEEKWIREGIMENLKEKGRGSRRGGVVWKSEIPLYNSTRPEGSGCFIKVHPCS
jgi:hypothetical protein